MEIIKILSSIPLFEGLNKDQIQKISNIIIDKQYSDKFPIFYEGDTAKGCYIIVSGRIKIFKISLSGKEQIIHIFDKNEIFGEVPVFSGTDFPANAETLEKSRLFFLPKDKLLNLIKKEPLLAMNMLASLSKRLRMLANLVENLSLKDVSGRFAGYILSISNEQGQLEVNIGIPKNQLASLLGTLPETLSRIIFKLVEQNIIEIKGKTVKIKNKKSLQFLAQTGQNENKRPYQNVN